jgi:serine/threonine protein phosphatase PrpC
MHNEARIFAKAEMEQGEVCRFAQGWAGVYSRPAPDKETYNEDAVALLPASETSGVLVVADGLGGMPAGEQASCLVLQLLKQEMAQVADPAAGLREPILNGIERANQAISSMGVGAATTLAAIEMQGATARSYHVGDAMILVVGQRGKLKLQTVSHSPVGYAVESGLLEETEAMNHEHRHLVSNMVGTPDMRIEVGSAITLAPRDTVLLATDGLFDNFTVDEIVARIRSGPMVSVMRTLVGDCLRRMTGPGKEVFSKADDLSFIIYRNDPKWVRPAG